MARYTKDAIKRLYKFFWPHWPTDAKPDWDELQSQLESMMVEVMRCSDSLSLVESIYDSVYLNPEASVTALFKDLAKSYAKDWLDGEQKLYRICRDRVAQLWVRPVEISLYKGHFD